MLVRLFFLEGRRSHSVFDNSKLIFFGRTKKSFRVRQQYAYFFWKDEEVIPCSNLSPE